MGLHVRAVFLLLCLTAFDVYAADICPAPPKYLQSRPADASSRTIITSTSTAMAAPRMTAATRRQQPRTSVDCVGTRAASRRTPAHYDRDLDKITVTRKVVFLDPSTAGACRPAAYELMGAAGFDQTNFQLMDRNGRGFAKDDSLGPRGQGRVETGALHQLSGWNRGLAAAGLGDRSRH